MVANKKKLAIIIAILIAMFTIVACGIIGDSISGYIILSNVEGNGEFDNSNTIKNNIQSSIEQTNKSGAKEYFPEQIIIKFNDDSLLEQISNEYNLDKLASLSELKTYLFAIEGQLEVEDLRKELANKEGVEYTEFNGSSYNIVATYPQQASDYNQQWHYDMISAPYAWSYNTGAKDITVAVLDTGIDGEHLDLKDNMVTGANFTDDDDFDVAGHGTHVAGTIGATGRERVVGVSWDVSLMPVKVLDDRGSGSNFDVAQGILWATNNGADIINLSLGSSWPHKTVEDAINYAYDNGVVIVAASGNLEPDLDPNVANKFEVDYPARYKNVISVGAVDANFEVADFSFQGYDLDLVAPGVNVYSTIPNGEYAYFNGTSMAAPHVSGLVALLLAEGVATTPEEVKEQLILTGHDIGAEQSASEKGWDFRYGHGLINAHAALTDAKINDVLVFTGIREGDTIYKQQETKVNKDGFYELNFVDDENYLYAWIDVTGSGSIETGDYYAKTLFPVRSGVGLDLTLELIRDDQFSSLEVR